MGRRFNRYVGFFNPAIQSVDRMIRASIEGETPKEKLESFLRTNMKSLMTVTVVSLLMWAFNHSDPDREKEYMELPQDQKDRYWLIRGNGVWYKFPKPFEVGYLYGTTLERFLDALYDKDPEPWRNYAKRLADYIVPPILPTALTPVFESFANKDVYFEKEIVPKSKQSLPPYLQFGPGTSEASKLFARSSIGKALGWSPYKIDHIIRGFGGDVARQGLSTLDMMFEAMGFRALPPERTVVDYPFASSFMMIPYRRSESVSKFYDYQERLISENAEAKYLNVKNVNAPVASRFNSTRVTLSKLWKKKNDLMNDTSVSPEAKRKRLDEIDMKAIEIAQRALEYYENKYKE